MKDSFAVDYGPIDFPHYMGVSVYMLPHVKGEQYPEGFGVWGDFIDKMTHMVPHTGLPMSAASFASPIRRFNNPLLRQETTKGNLAHMLMGIGFLALKVTLFTVVVLVAQGNLTTLMRQSSLPPMFWGQSIGMVNGMVRGNCMVIAVILTFLAWRKKLLHLGEYGLAIQTSSFMSPLSLRGLS